MAFELASILEEQEGCKEWYFIDSTGTYNATTNPTGYGAPNVASANVTTATLYILPYSYTTGWLFTFTIISGDITACTVTAPDGTVTNIFADLQYTVFPFSETNPFVVISDWLGMGEDSELTSSVYSLEYHILGSVFDHVFTEDVVVVCKTCCCVASAAADLAVTECSCEDEKLEKAMEARIYLDSAIYAMENGEVDKSYTNLMHAQEVCTGKCKSC